MKRTATSCIIAFLLMTPVVAEESAQDNKDVRYSVSSHAFQVNDQPYAHPQKLTQRQVTRILSAIRTWTPSGRGKALFSAEERVQLAPKVVELFGSIGTDKQVEIVRETTIHEQNSSSEELLLARVFMCFLDPHTIYVAVRTEGGRHKSVLTLGNFMAPYQKQDGTIVPNIVLLLESMWTTKLMEPIFDANMEGAMKMVEQAQSGEGQQMSGVPAQGGTTETITIEQLESELQKLQSLLDKEMITKEEYQAFRKELLKKAGIGGGR